MGDSHPYGGICMWKETLLSGGKAFENYADWNEDNPHFKCIMCYGYDTSCSEYRPLRALDVKPSKGGEI